MKKLLAIISAFAISFSGFSTFAVAESVEKGNSTNAVYVSETVDSGWKTINGATYYYVNNNKVKNKTKKIDGKIYLFGKTGKLLSGGIYSVNGKKYHTNKDGVVTCNKWFQTKVDGDYKVYRYATKTGAIKEFSFEPLNIYGTDGSLLALQIMVDGKPATSKDFPALGEYGSHSGLIRFNKDYYSGYIGVDNSFVICNFTEGGSGDNAYSSILDAGSNKYLAYGYSGELVINSRGCVVGGSFYNTEKKALYRFNGEGKAWTKTSSSPVVIIYNASDVNSAGGVNWNLSYINNSRKTIKYATFTVEGINAVGDSVYCSIRRRNTFNLQQTGPVSAYKTTSPYWEAFMYNYSVKTVRVISATIEYMDGTVKTYSEKDIDILI